jgi:hypothetical protein
MRPAQAGSRPSFAIARKIRGWASIITTITELNPASAPTVTSTLTTSISPAHGVAAARTEAASTATTSGAGSLSISRYGTRPTITPDTST